MATLAVRVKAQLPHKISRIHARYSRHQRSVAAAVQPTQLVNPRHAHCVSFTPDGGALALALGDGSVEVRLAASDGGGGGDGGDGGSSGTATEAACKWQQRERTRARMRNLIINNSILSQVATRIGCNTWSG